MSDGLAFGEWMASWFGLCKDINYDLRKRDTLNRDIQLQSIMTGPKSDLPKLLASLRLKEPVRQAYCGTVHQCREACSSRSGRYPR